MTWFAKNLALTSMVSRIVAAVFGGYVLAHTLSVALVAAWPMTRADAALSAMQLSFVVYVFAVLWVFAARSAKLAWLGIAVSAAISGLIAWGLIA